MKLPHRRMALSPLGSSVGLKQSSSVSASAGADAAAEIATMKETTTARKSHISASPKFLSREFPAKCYQDIGRLDRRPEQTGVSFASSHSVRAHPVILRLPRRA